MIFGDTSVKPRPPDPMLSRAAMGLVIAVAGLVLVPAPATPQTPADKGRLSAILQRSADYCQRLDRAVMDFVCLEEVSETSHNLTPDTNVYLYDYQFVRKAGGGAKERRNLVSVNGKKADTQNTPLHTGFFQYRNVLFGPIGLLSRYWQAFLDYRIVGEDEFDGQKTVVVDAVPAAAFAEPHPYGLIWIREKDGGVLKIVWDQRSLGNFKMAEEWAKEHESEPQITSYSEYGFEKNGIRFPSRSYTEQAYVRKDRGKSVSAEVSVTYRKYKFFTVETETVF
jgi:hypothetical protein